MRRKYRNTQKNYYAVIQNDGLLRYFVIIGDKHIEVEEPVFKVYSKSVRKEMYFEEQYDKLLTDLDHPDIKKIAVQSAELEVMSQLMSAKLYGAYSRLTRREQELVSLLYFNNLSLRDVASRLDIHFTTVNYMKKKILVKMLDFILQTGFEKDN